MSNTGINANDSNHNDFSATTEQLTTLHACVCIIIHFQSILVTNIEFHGLSFSKKGYVTKVFVQDNSLIMIFT